MGNELLWYYTRESLSEEMVDKALRPALMRVGENNILPLRGPEVYINGDYKYTFKANGTMEAFEGIEEIYKNNEKIYVLRCHGGNIRR